MSEERRSQEVEDEGRPHPQVTPGAQPAWAVLEYSHFLSLCAHSVGQVTVVLPVPQHVGRLVGVNLKVSRNGPK